MAVEAGMRSLRDRCLDLVREGVTTFDEFARPAPLEPPGG